LSGLRRIFLIRSARPTISPACGPPSAAEGHQVSTGLDRLAHRRFVRQAPAGRINERAAAQVHPHRDAMPAGDLRHPGHVHAAGEAADGVVAAVDLHQHRGARADGVFIIRRMGAVGGAHLHQLRAGAGHDVGDPERAADLHQLAARHHHLAPVGQRIEHQQHRGGVVVDHRRGLGAGQLAQQVFDQLVAVAAGAAAQVELQRHRRGQRAHHRLQRLLGQRRPPQVGVQHGAGEVEHAAQARARAFLQRAANLRGQRPGCQRIVPQAVLQRRLPQRAQPRAQGGGHPRLAVPIEQRRERRVPQQAVQ
jgi:hypothetical protein